ncbi:MAG: hypothetical protein ACYC1D_11495 [Acidimicrobiales bacterium]
MPPSFASCAGQFAEVPARALRAEGHPYRPDRTGSKPPAPVTTAAVGLFTTFPAVEDPDQVVHR